MSNKAISSGPPLTRKKYTSAFKAECVRQVAAGARQTDVTRAQGLSPALLGRWQRQALVQAVPSSAEREEIKQLRAELRRVKQISGCADQLGLFRPGSQLLPRLSLDMRTATIRGAYGRNYEPKATQLGAMPCVPGCAVAACEHSAHHPS